MKRVKEKMYNYEVTPPFQSWQIISTALDEVNRGDKQPVQKSSHSFYVSLAAAAVAIVIFSVFIWLNNSEKKVNQTITGQMIKTNQPILYDKITVPSTNNGEDNSARANANMYNGKLNAAASEAGVKKYIIICGPQGQPVKISSKVISLIVSSDDQNPPNAVWNSKVNKWKDIMKANILAPATADFLDIVDLTHALKINNP